MTDDYIAKYNRTIEINAVLVQRGGYNIGMSVRKEDGTTEICEGVCAGYDCSICPIQAIKDETEDAE